MTDYIESAGVKDVLGVKLIGANSQVVDSATLAEQQAQTALLDDIKNNTTGLVKNDKEIPFVWFLVKQAFTDVTTDDIVVCYSIINTETGEGTSYTKRWRGWIDVTVPSPLTDYLVPTGGMPLTLAQLQSAGLATSAKQDTLLATQYIDVVTAQTVNTSGTSAQSAAVNANTKMIAVTATKACWILLGSNPTATVGGAGCIYLGDGQTYFPLKVTGGTTKVAVIQDSAAGKINIVESA